MSALNSEQLPILAGSLLRLRGLTLAAVCLTPPVFARPTCLLG